MVLCRVARGHLWHSHVRDHCRLSPLLQPSRLQAQSSSSVCPRLSRPDQRANGRFLVGGASSRAPSLFGYRRRYAFPGNAEYLVGAYRMSIAGSSSEYDSRLMQDFEKFTELKLLNKYHRLPAILFGAVVFAMGGYAAFLGIRTFDCPAVALHVFNQFPGTRLGIPALRNGRPEPQQPFPRADHAR